MTTKSFLSRSPMSFLDMEPSAIVSLRESHELAGLSVLDPGLGRDGRPAMLFEQIHRQGDRFLVRFLAFHAVVALFLAPFRQTWIATIIVGAVAAGAFVACLRWWPGRPLTRAVGGVSLQAFVALHVWQLNGQPEMHYFFFPALAALIVYQDWRCLVPAWTGTVVLYSVCAFLQNAGEDTGFFPVPWVGGEKLFFHFAITAMHAALCGFWADFFRRRTLRGALRRLDLERAKLALEADIEERRRVERQLRSTRNDSQRLATVANTTGNAVLITSPTGGVEWTNDAFHRLLALELGEVAGCEVSSFLPPDGKALPRLPAEGHWEWSIDVRGRRLTLLVDCRPVRGGRGGAPAGGWVIVASDVTALRAAEQELVQSRKLSLLGELAGGVAHEFNNLLTPILARAEMLRDEHGEEYPALAEGLASIAAASSRAAELTRRILNFSRRADRRRQPVRLDQVARGVAQLLKSTIDRRITLDFRIDPTLPALLADPIDLQQSLLNLILNARDTLVEKLLLPPGERPEGWQPHITVETAAAPARGGQRISVRDNGLGLAPETRRRLFEPFFTTKKAGAGTGLGLAAVWHAMSETGGTVEVESTPGEGTSFHLFLPLVHADAPEALEASPATTAFATLPFAAKAEPPAAGLAPAAGPEEEDLHVLLVEDDTMVRDVLAAVLRRGGVRVATAEDGEGGLEQLRAGNFQVLVTDLNMPGMSGLELVQAAREAGFIGRVVVVSGFTGEQPEEMVEAGGVDAVLLKPVQPADLLRSLRGPGVAAA